MATVTLEALDEIEQKVLAAFEEGYEYLILVLPGKAGVNDLAVALALAKFKKLKLAAFDGRGNMRSVCLTDEGEALRKQIAA